MRPSLTSRLELDDHRATLSEAVHKLSPILCSSHRRASATAVNELARESFRFIAGNRYRTKRGAANGHSDEHRRGNAEALDQCFDLAGVDFPGPIQYLADHRLGSDLMSQVGLLQLMLVHEEA